MLEKTLQDYHIILASQSPRRQYLLKELGLEFETKVKNFYEENFPKGLKRADIPLHIARQKAEHYGDVPEDTILITADTIVWLNDKLIQKPGNYEEAFQMLKKLSGNCHQVYTGVCLRTSEKIHRFSVCTDVYFKELSEEEIEYYITNYAPYDKAGSYGIQEWIGYIGVEKIEGSFFNVMGLPVQHLYTELKNFI